MAVWKCSAFVSIIWDLSPQHRGYGFILPKITRIMKRSPFSNQDLVGLSYGGWCSFHKNIEKESNNEKNTDLILGKDSGIFTAAVLNACDTKIIKNSGFKPFNYKLGVCNWFFGKQIFCKAPVASNFHPKYIIDF